MTKVKLGILFLKPYFHGFLKSYAIFSIEPIQKNTVRILELWFGLRLISNYGVGKCVMLFSTYLSVRKNMQIEKA